MMIRYECQNCEKKFELAEGSELRCPHCFWTTSVHPLDEYREAKPKDTKPIASKPAIRLNPRVLTGFLIATGIAIACILILKSGAVQKTGNFIRGKISKPKISAPEEKLKAAPGSPSKGDPLSLLSDDDRKVLQNRVLIEIPRKLSDEEKDIVSRKVDLNISIQESGELKFWTVDEFKKFLKSEQEKRKIYFSWSYEKLLHDLFNDHYLKAQILFSSGQGEAARTELLSTLLIPRYSEDLRIHRAVGLVMLKGFIDDVVRKIKVLNSYSVRQEIIVGANQLKEDYASFFNLVNEQKWEDALAFVDRLQDKAKHLDMQTKEVNVQYPPIFGQIDPDIKVSLNVPAQDFASASSDLNSFIADLKIKRNTIEQNTEKSLTAVKNQYDSALKAIQEKRWVEAKQILEGISYPPELTVDTRHKAAILSKLVPQSEST